MKAGAFTPATPLHHRRFRPLMDPLNEGGGFHPRNARPRHDPRRLLRRSMKAGAFTPATLVIADQLAHAARRSMKAGAFTPATPVLDAMEAWKRLAPLNEGGGFHPRNACPRSYVELPSQTAQ